MFRLNALRSSSLRFAAIAPWLACVVLGPWAPGRALAANLLENGDFAVDTTGWSCDGDGSDGWTSLDLNQSGSSGSLEMLAAASTMNSPYFCRQCVELDDSSEFQLSLWTYWPNVERGLAVGTTRISMGFFETTDCSGDSTFLGLETFTPPFNEWTPGSTLWVEAPVGSQSAVALVTTWANDMGDSVTANYDGIVLRGNEVFADDFEDESVCRWSQVIGTAPTCR